MMEMIEGSHAVAEAVRLSRPQVISAYPITPQTHISEELSTIIADGELDAEFVKVESEFGAASVVTAGWFVCANPSNGFSAVKAATPAIVPGGICNPWHSGGGRSGLPPLSSSLAFTAGAVIFLTWSRKQFSISQ